MTDADPIQLANLLTQSQQDLFGQSQNNAQTPLKIPRRKQPVQQPSGTNPQLTTEFVSQIQLTQQTTC